MKTISRLLTGLLLLGNLLLLTALSLHVVKTPTTTTVVMKDHLTLVGTYMDVSNWTAADLSAHPGFEMRLKEAGKADLLSHITPVHASAGSSSNSASVAIPTVQTPNLPIESALNIPSTLTAGTEKPALKPAVNPLAKPAASSSAQTPAPKPASNTPADGGGKSIFDFGQ